ncbi:MAG: Abi family protein, partial [Bacteroidales bacterium]|nr:Abi family protein [Bacteroidales bacterium]
MKEYTKPPLTYQQQVELLKSRGLLIPDEERAIRHLSNISYYRLSAYMLPCKKIKDGRYTDHFSEGKTWDDVYNLYLFDRKLRLLVFDAIERLEISIRTQIIYQLSHKYGSHWQDNPDIFNVIHKKDKDGRDIEINVHTELNRHIAEQLHNNKAEAFIQHYREMYDHPPTPPSWMSVEIMYFNHLSRICSALKSRSDVVGIASYYGMPPRQFCSWLHTINYVRNLC